MTVRCSYERFFLKKYLTQKQFFDFGLEETIYANFDKAEQGWEDLKKKILNNGPVYIRGFGRNAAGTPLFIDFYKKVFGNENIRQDSTNNAEPTKIIKGLTGFSKGTGKNFELLQNYQICHVYGRTKNLYAFTAPWNIVYAPKILDPYTGHEARGEGAREYQALFLKQTYEKFKDLIEDYNSIVTSPDLQNKITDALTLIKNDKIFNSNDLDKLQKSIKTEFAPIRVNHPD